MSKGYVVTSILAYRDYVESGKALTARERVLSYIKAVPYRCNREISKALGMTINNVTARANELMHDGLIERPGKKKDLVTGSTVFYWVAKEAVE